MTIAAFGWDTLPPSLNPNAGETVADWYARIAAYAAANPTALDKILNVSTLEAFTQYLGAYTDTQVAAEASARATADALAIPLTQKGAASGVAPLNSSSRVPIANLGSGTPDGTKFLRDDGVLATPPSAGSGVPAGGTTGQVLAKNSNTDGDAGWVTGSVPADAAVGTKGISMLSKAPAVAATPIALGVNDERVSPQTSASANLTGTLTPDFASLAQEKWLPGPLTGNLVVNPTNPVAGSRLRILAVQGATPRTITVDGNAVSPISQVNGALILVDVLYVDIGGTITPRIVATTTEADPLAILKSLVNAKGDLIAATADDTVARVAVGADNSILVGDSAASAGVSYKTLLTLLAAGLTPTNGNVITGNGSTWTSAAPAAGGSGGLGGTFPLLTNEWNMPPMVIAGTNIPSINARGRARKFVAGRSTTIDGVRIRVEVAGTASVAKFRFAIYSDVNGRPGTKIGSDSGQIDVGSTGEKNATGLGAAVTAGTAYWLVGAQQGAPATPAQFKGSSGRDPDPFCPVDTGNIGLGCGLHLDSSASFDSGALPADLSGSAGSWSISSDMPVMAVRSVT